jgi:hypothetical protein
VVELRHRGQAYPCTVSQIAGDRHRVTIGGVIVEAGVQRVGAYERWVELAGVTYRTLISEQGADLLVEVNGVSHRIGRDDGGMVRNLAPAIVVSIPVAPGDEVEAGDVIAVVESMKMETSLVAPFRGRVRHVLAGPNVHVAAHAPLLQLEPLDVAAPGGAAGERISFTALRAAPPVAPQRCRENLERLEWAVLGFDIDAAEVERIASDLHGECSDLMACDPALVSGEHRLLAQFAELGAARARPDGVAGRIGESEPFVLRPPLHGRRTYRRLGTEVRLGARIHEKRMEIAHFFSSPMPHTNPWNCRTFNRVRAISGHD